MGWTGTILRVNLSNGSVAKEPLNPQLARAYIGGRGLATKILYDEIDPRLDPLGPANKLILATGPLTGTNAPTGGRYMVVTKSPLTGAIACSNSGGYVGAEMKYAGYDLVIVEGKAPHPVYLWVNNDKVEIREAAKVWGKSTHETEDILHNATNAEAKICSIGPAGEKLSLTACIINDKHRAAGRSGVGAVMGSKNLKAVVFRGTQSVKVAQPQAFMGACLTAVAKLKGDPAAGAGLPMYGTPGIVNVINAHGFMPTNNFQFGQFAGAERISGETIRDEILTRNKGCFACTIACARVTEVKAGKFKGSGEGPEYETVWGLGAMTGVSDLAAVTKAGYLCNELGMDTIEAGVAIATAMELFERGYIPEREIGRSLRFGDADALVEMTEKLGRGEGFGAILALGGARVAERYGHPELFMGVKKQAFAAYDGRGAQGMALGYATSNRGACHLRGYTISAEVFGVPLKVDPFAIEGKAAMSKASQDVTAFVDSTGACLFTTFALEPADIHAMLELATGVGYTLGEVIQIGERIWNLERLFNLRAGLSAKDDTLPRRILEEPIPAGPAKGKVARLGEMLPEYYRLRGWDPQGVPTQEKLRELGL
ncbi:aldehyde ferredoxin oxidoreductase [Candidatus Methylomirabilis limnetica]|uniref:Aldehyde ferredoxin oxidoreductase n=1 Tax=Candidatus Methylomirabilis limnetica TaxID=2033718 RepID=A0A2T4TYM0_9BACT|nr:aldehyde ferredoxin oxidoreductase family protein [Candidatus Methylomirabilis limnetica]PTL36206.1 aldehyde ferredoxin oxidoreductase [Candidatus Methylomirabilis limnetica]